MPPCHRGRCCENSDALGDRERHSSAKIEEVAPSQPVVVVPMIEGELPPIVAGKDKGAGHRPLDSVMHELERLDKLDGRAWCDELSDRTIKAVRFGWMSTAS